MFGLGLITRGASGASGSGEWVRPSDWLPMPTTAANQVDVLCAVFDDDANYVAVKATTSAGTYSVDWGDGTVDTGIASNVQCNHVYSYSSISSSTNCSRGYRQAMIKITPATGNLTGVFLDSAHPTVGSNPSRQWLDVQLNAPSCITFTEASASIVERCNIVAIGPVTNASYMHSGCYSLQSITYPAGSLASLTNATGMHSDCYSLQSITYPAGSLAALTDATDMHAYCTSLQSITYPAGSLTALTNAAEMHAYCYSLQSITYPAGSLASLTNASYMHYGCSSLQSITYPAGSLTALTDATDMHAYCTSLQSITYPAGSLAAVTNASNMHSGCTSLSKITNCAVPISFSVASCKLSAAALDAIYTALPTVTSKTITVSGNFGTASDTPSIATAKGWTVTG